MHTLKKLTPNILVEDVEQTIKFYETVFEFELTSSVPGENETYQWASMKNGAVELMFQSRKSLATEIAYFEELPMAASSTLFIETAGIHELYQRVKGQVEIVSDLHTTSYGMREFAVRDSNGYVLVFAEPVGDA